uniref:Sprouty-related, EVH1 domain-containing protein 2 n=1 Tax=Gadus morhua TaxID=8049 RepID=A0A8C5C8R7_GADMO
PRSNWLVGGESERGEREERDRETDHRHPGNHDEQTACPRRGGPPEVNRDNAGRHTAARVILECPLRKDLLYTAATPTFHHWKVEDRRCGLSFQSPADARAFDRGVRKAIEDLAEGSTTSSTTLHNGAELGDDDVFTNATDSSSNSSQRTEGCQPPHDTSPLARRQGCRLGHHHGNDFYEPYRLTDQFLFEQSLSRFPRHVTFQEEEEIVRINPRERSWESVPERSWESGPERSWESGPERSWESGPERSWESGPERGWESGPERGWESGPERGWGRGSERAWRTGYEDYRHAAVRDHFLHSDPSSSYVHFSKTDGPKHEYSYPLAPPPDGPQGPLSAKLPGHARHGGFSGVVSAQPRPFLPGSSPSDDDGGSGGGVKGGKAGSGGRAQCEHCGETFYPSANRRGRCQDAPDAVGGCVRRVSCMWLADSMLYHCMSDPEGDFSDPCSCEGGGGGGARRGPRWLALGALSLVAPCLCLYPPLHACHRAALAWGCCGGRHKAAS